MEKIFSLIKPAVLAPFQPCAPGHTQQRDNIGGMIAEGVEVIDAEMPAVITIFLIL